MRDTRLYEMTPALAQGFQSGADPGAAESKGQDARGTISQLRLGVKLSKLPRSHSQRHI